MKKMIEILKSKWLRNNSKTALFILIIVCIFIVINISVQKLDPKDIDLTPEKLYSLTDESKKIISSIPKEDKIEIYLFDYTESDPLFELASQYHKINENITVQALNVDDRPDLKSKYNIETGYYTILMLAGEKSKLLTSSDFSSYDYSSNNYTDLSEQRLTNNIVALSSIAQNTSIYFLVGHDEYSVTTGLARLGQYLTLENYEAKSLNLLSEQKVPDDCRALVIASPSKDFTELEANSIKEYIAKGGNILWLSDPYSSSEETPQIKSILDLYGVTIRQDGLVLEQDTSKMIMNMSNMILPTVEASTITDKVDIVLLLNSGKLEFLSDEKLNEAGITKTDLLTTSEKSFFRTDTANRNLTPSESEIPGVNTVAAMLEKSNNDNNTSSKLIVFANNLFASDQAVYAGSSMRYAVTMYNNSDIILNSIKDLAGVEDGLSIRKAIEITYYTPTEAQDGIVKTVIIILPIIVLVIGIVIWVLRRRKK